MCVYAERDEMLKVGDGLWGEYFPLTAPNTPTGWEIEEQLWPSADLLCEAPRARQWPTPTSMCADVLTCHGMIICVLVHVLQGDMCACRASALLNYRVCLLFNRSAEEVMPQSMSQPSCIIAPLCHCQGLSRATSDCFPTFPPFSFSLSLSLYSH